MSTELQHNKLICHNYGQGGAGWTFLFGCVAESIRQFEQQLEQNTQFKNKPIAVIGAGCYGLLTAIMLARKGYTVKIIAAETDNLPSYKAAGFFFPRARKTSTPHERAIFESLGIESYSVYKQIIAGNHPFIKSGPKLVPAYYGLDIDPGFAPYITQGLIATPEPSTINFGNSKTYQALEYKTVFIDSVTIMQELQRTINELGIPITQRKIELFGDVAEPIIFNCAGLGAKKLTADKRLIPVQGHLITLKNQPDLEQLQYMINVQIGNKLIYYAPKESGILGITFMRGQDSLTANHHEFELLLQRCQDFFGT